MTEEKSAVEVLCEKHAKLVAENEKLRAVVDALTDGHSLRKAVAWFRSTDVTETPVAVLACEDVADALEALDLGAS